MDRLTASKFSGVREIRGRPHVFFFTHTSRLPEVLNPQQNGFSVRYSVPRGGFGGEYGTHAAPLR